MLLIRRTSNHHLRPSSLQSKQRDACLAEQKRLDEFNNQVETIKSTLSKAATELAQRTAQSSQAKLDLDEKRQRLDAARKRYAVLKRRLETEFSQLDTMESKVEELEAMRKVSGGCLLGLANDLGVNGLGGHSSQFSPQDQKAILVYEILHIFLLSFTTG